MKIDTKQLTLWAIIIFVPFGFLIVSAYCAYRLSKNKDQAESYDSFGDHIRSISQFKVFRSIFSKKSAK